MGEKLLDNADLDNVDLKSDQVRNLREVESNAMAVSNLTDADVVPLSMESFPTNVPLPCSVYLKVNGKYVLFRNQGDKLAHKRAFELSARGAVTFYLQEKMWRVFCDFVEGVGPNSTEPKDKALHIRQMMLVFGQELERRNRESRRQLFEKLQKHSFEMAGLVRSSPALAREMLSQSAATTGRFPAHALNSAVYAGLIGVRMGLSLEDLRQLVYGTMVHDAGKLTLDKKFLAKKGDFTADEIALLKTHPRLGAEMLQSYIATPSVILTALQHHERFDGTGYPNKLKGEQIHPFARICAIADTFDSLTSERPYREKISAVEALKKMAADNGRFDTKYLTAIPRVTQQ